MKKTLLLVAMFNALTALSAEPALTIYNKNFAVVRDTVPLDLKAGVNDVRFSDVTAQAETDSVILSDPSGKVKLEMLEQSYRNDPVSTGFLLSLNEGKNINFFVHETNKADRVVQGKVIRSGYRATTQNRNEPLQPIIEVDGELQFSLLGEPHFPNLGDDTILNPTMTWKLNASAAAKFDAELAYITGGLWWHADYNIVANEKDDLVNLVGLVTFVNSSGKTFRDARIKLMAGDVNKLPPLQPPEPFGGGAAYTEYQQVEAGKATEKTFSEFHLYTISRPTTLRDNESKQVEFVRAQGISANRIYIYDGATLDYGSQPAEDQGNNLLPMNKSVWVLREFKNSEANHLGMPIPGGRLRFYQQDEDRQLEFIGESGMDHMPKDETVRAYVGNSFDLAGERHRTDFHRDDDKHTADESFEIKLRNHKKNPVEIRVVEHLGVEDVAPASFKWDVKQAAFKKTDSNTIEARVTIKPDEEKVITYRVDYTW
ncbi:MAG: hypothetical protein QOD99_463 [Chthoniobacter sp.]|jgi:hypothetical protein|nr:hypothetical protein [Chthoniobacter sp.]